MKRKFFFLFIPLIICLSCNDNANDNPSESKPKSEAEKIFTEVVEPQEENYTTLLNLLTEMDTMAAMDSVLQIFLQDTLVDWGEVGKQGIGIQYKNGIRGGIFLDPLDSPDSLIEQTYFNKLPKEFENYKVNNTRPEAKKTIFLNPTYWERKYWADLIIQNYNDRLPAAGYEKPVVYKNSEVTIDKYKNLSGYGIVHIYSHGWAWPSEKDIKEVYLMTGESYSNATFENYVDDILNGDIPIVALRDNNTYWVSPEFIAKHNNFLADTTLIYGGFCYSYLGNWPGTMINTANAGGYFGFDWWVWTHHNAKWNLDLMMNLSDTSQNPPFTTSNWMNSDFQKWYWNYEDDRPVYIKYLGYPDLSLVKEEKLPKFNACLFSLSITMDLQVSTGEVYIGDRRFLTPGGDITKIEEGLEETKYFMNWDEQYDDGTSSQGGLELTINNSTRKITSYKGWNDENHYLGKEIYSFEGTEINATIQYDDSQFCSARIEGEDVCNSINALTYSFDWFDEERTLNKINYYCDQSSYINVLFWIE